MLMILREISFALGWLWGLYFALWRFIELDKSPSLVIDIYEEQNDHDLLNALLVQLCYLSSVILLTI